MRLRLALRSGLALLLAAASAQAQSVDARLADLRLATAVRLALVADAATRGLDVDVTSDGGAVRLAGAGAVNTQAERVARGVPGVRSVNGQGAGVASAPGSTAPRPEPVPTGPVRSAPAEARPAETSGAEAPRAAGWGRPSGAEPAPAPRAEPAGPAVHTVARGDTLFSLARRYGLTVEALRRLNGLGPTDGIEIGRRLRLR
jgi:hypothetical protein